MYLSRPHCSLLFNINVTLFIHSFTMWSTTELELIINGSLTVLQQVAQRARFIRLYVLKADSSWTLPHRQMTCTESMASKIFISPHKNAQPWGIAWCQYTRKRSSTQKRIAKRRKNLWSVHGRTYTAWQHWVKLFTKHDRGKLLWPTALQHNISVTRY